MKYTPEPWMIDDGCIRIDEQYDMLRANIVTDEEWVSIGAECKDEVGLHSALALAHPSNAERIIACVNACKGIADPQAAITALREAASKALERLFSHAEQAGPEIRMLEAAILNSGGNATPPRKPATATHLALIRDRIMEANAHLTAETAASGGALDCIEVRDSRIDCVFLWGTANATWACDVYLGSEAWDRMFSEDVIASEIDIEEIDPVKVADAIARLTADYVPAMDPKLVFAHLDVALYPGNEYSNMLLAENADKVRHISCGMGFADAWDTLINAREVARVIHQDGDERIRAAITIYHSDGSFQLPACTLLHGITLIDRMFPQDADE